MLKRLLVALFEGSLAGGGVAFVLWRLSEAPAALLLYAAAAAAGALTGLIAGRPIWARAAKLEGLLKALAGVFMAVTVLYGARKWLPGVTVDLTRFGAGRGPVGYVAWAALPLIAVAIALVFEIDDAFGGDGPAPELRKRVEDRLRAPSLESLDDEAESADSVRRGRK
jgi:hypothetical protein